MAKQVTVGLCGAEGYVGQELTKLIVQHPYLKLSGIVPRGAAPSASSSFDVLLLATPPEASMVLAAQYADRKIKIIDLSGAFRLSAEDFVKWYEMPHTATYLLHQSTYGLSPWWTNDHNKISLLANPGCYATCALMSLIPLLKDNIIQTNSIIIDAKSGVSGAGKKAKQELLFSEMSNNFFPYKVGKHQHAPEINLGLMKFANKACDVTLTTQLLPVVRGIAMSIYAHAATYFDSDQEIANAVIASYQEVYRNYPLVEMHDVSDLSLKNVYGTPKIHIGYWINNRKITLFSYLDNLLKGAATQAIENVNLLFNFPVTTGLLNSQEVL